MVQVWSVFGLACSGHRARQRQQPAEDAESRLALSSSKPAWLQLLRRKTCALLRAKTSALLRRKTCAVLRARTCALFRANTKEAAFGRLHKGGRPSAAPLCGFLCIGSEQSTCPSSQHSTYLASQQGRCLGSQQGTRLASTFQFRKDAFLLFLCLFSCFLLRVNVLVFSPRGSMFLSSSVHMCLHISGWARPGLRFF